MKNIHLIALVGVGLLLAPSKTIAIEPQLDAAVRAALDEEFADEITILKPAQELLKPTFELFKHQFRVHAAELVDRNSGKFTVVGKLTHLSASGGTNDEIIYRFVKENGVVKKITWQINGSESRLISEPMIRALLEIRPREPITPAQRQRLNTALENAVDQTWQKAAEYLIAHIANRHC